MKVAHSIASLCLLIIVCSGMTPNQRNVNMAEVMSEAKVKADIAHEQRITSGARRRKATPE